MDAVDLAVLGGQRGLDRLTGCGAALLTSNGEAVSWFVAATTRLRSDLRKTAAPKTLQPEATPSAVRGMILSVVVVRKRSRRVEGEAIV